MEKSRVRQFEGERLSNDFRYDKINLKIFSMVIHAVKAATRWTLQGYRCEASILTLGRATIPKMDEELVPTISIIHKEA